MRECIFITQSELQVYTSISEFSIRWEPYNNFFLIEFKVQRKSIVLIPFSTHVLIIYVTMTHVHKISYLLVHLKMANLNKSDRGTCKEENRSTNWNFY